MAFDVQRKAELAMVSLLANALPDFVFYPSKGGDDDGGVTKPVPPFGTVWIDSAEKTIAYERTWFLNGTCVWITRSVTQDVSDHTDVVTQIYNALLSFQEQSPISDTTHSLLIHGLDVGLVSEFTDSERLAHGDAIQFTMGVTEED
jgi:hypothetical protein